LYRDLAWLWPLWEDVGAYEHETDIFIRLIRNNSKIKAATMLDIGCGGGKHDFWLKKHFAVTGIDLSKAMLSLARELNPECEYCLGDMRNFNQEKEFDAVFMNDSIMYMATKEDLSAALKNGHCHLRKGGVMICFAEQTKERFVQNQTQVSPARSRLKPPNLEITFIENSYDPDPEDDSFEATFIYLIREKGSLKIEHDTHVLGLFPIDFWRSTLNGIGFNVQEQILRIDEIDLPTFVCLKT